MFCPDSWLNQQTPTGWLANVNSAIYKSRSPSNSCIQETMTPMLLLKVMQTSVEILMIEYQALVFFRLRISEGAVSCQTKKGCNSWGSHVPAITIVWNGLSAVAGYGKLWTTRAALNRLPIRWCINDRSTSTRDTTSFEKKLMTTQFNWSTRQLINWQQICWRSHFHKWKLGNIESNYWVSFRFFLEKTENFEWGCWRWEFRFSWAKKLENFSFSSWKLRRNKLTCDRNSMLTFLLCFYGFVRNVESCPTWTKFSETQVC